MASHILVIDADASAAEVTCALVRRLAPSATIAREARPEQGWLAAQRTVPDVLIIDPSSHDSTGTLLIQLCQKQNPGIRVIVLASVPTPVLRRQLQHLDVHMYLEKPVASALLVDQLRAGLNGYAVPKPNAASADMCLADSGISI